MANQKDKANTTEILEGQAATNETNVNENAATEGTPDENLPETNADAFDTGEERTISEDDTPEVLASIPTTMSVEDAIKLAEELGKERKILLPGGSSNSVRNLSAGLYTFKPATGENAVKQSSYKLNTPTADGRTHGIGFDLLGTFQKAEGGLPGQVNTADVLPENSKYYGKISLDLLNRVYDEGTELYVRVTDEFSEAKQVAYKRATIFAA